MKKIVYLLLLGLASCQQDDIITEVPKDDWSVRLFPLQGQAQRQRDT